MNRLESLREIVAQAVRGDLAFPTSIAVATRIRVALGDANIHMGEATRLIQTEPLLAARAVAMSNSVTYQRNGLEITDVGTAVHRLGMRTLRSLAHALIVRQLAGAPKDKALQDMARTLWERTAHVASLSRLIARRITKLDPDTALFAGLVHDMGGFYLLSRANEFPALLDPDRKNEEEEFEVAVNRAVASTLALPQVVLDALETVWSGYLASPLVTLGDTVLLAKTLAPISSPFVQLPDKRMLAPVDMQVGEGEMLTGILQESAEEVRSVEEALTF
jgi:HD-like signal output (HDOD) protein